MCAGLRLISRWFFSILCHICVRGVLQLACTSSWAPNFMLVAWWEYLYHGNLQMWQIWAYYFFNVVNIDQYMVLFCFQAHIGSCIILLATEEGHVTISDQRNMGRSSNCPFSAEAEKKPMEKYPVSLLCYRKYKRSQSPSVLSWTSQLSRTTHLCCKKPWDLRVLLLLQNLKLLWQVQWPFHRIFTKYNYSPNSS